MVRTGTILLALLMALPVQAGETDDLVRIINHGTDQERAVEWMKRDKLLKVCMKEFIKTVDGGNIDPMFVARGAFSECEGHLNSMDLLLPGRHWRNRQNVLDEAIKYTLLHRAGRL